MKITTNWRRVLRIVLPTLLLVAAGLIYTGVQQWRNPPPPPMLMSPKGPDGKPLPVETLGRWSGTVSCTAVCKTQTVTLTLMRHTDGSPAWYRLEQIYKGDPGGDHVEHSLGPWSLLNGSYLLRADRKENEFIFVPSADGETLRIDNPSDSNLRDLALHKTDMQATPGSK